MGRGIGVKLLLTLSCFLSWTPFVAVIILQNVFEVTSAAPVYPALNCALDSEVEHRFDL